MSAFGNLHQTRLFLIPYETNKFKFYLPLQNLTLHQARNRTRLRWIDRPRLTATFKPGLLKLWVPIPFGAAKYNFGVAKQIGLTKQIQMFLLTNGTFACIIDI